jgi:hypothetical protein
VIRWIFAILLLSAGCLEDYDVEGMTYPCREPDDCADGYECHPTRFVCVEAGTSSTASALDAGRADR